MNVHYLELFYYVAKHGGISAAVRKIPYGIQQPAVSGQMGKLESEVGSRLFERSPFRLTPAGEKLFAHVRPFFENLTSVAAELREAAEPALRIGGSEIVLRDHIPTVMQRVREAHPKIRLSLHSGHQAQLESWLRDGQIDIAVGPVEARPPARLRQLRLARTPVVLLVNRRQPWGTAAEVWEKKRVTVPLIGLPAATAVMQNFQRDLKRRRIVWPQAIEVTSVELVTRYVASGHGCGVNLAIPSVIKHREVRVLPLEGFEPMTMGVLWRGDPSPLLRAVIEGVRAYSHQTWPDWACDDTLPPA
ncbi:MAG TPA: LysR family transcriptional regulator [Opitutaceae bacterium]|nr:LysR family transcriptional regulator [Opitutaceae bacterium]HND61560.1 LysR family transcriptional regulator [Opitutaceae bacterium]